MSSYRIEARSGLAALQTVKSQSAEVQSFPICCARAVPAFHRDFGLSFHSGPCEMVLCAGKWSRMVWFCPRCGVSYFDDRTDGMLGDRSCPECGRTREDYLEERREALGDGPCPTCGAVKEWRDHSVKREQVGPS